MSEPPPIASVAMMRRHLPDGYVLVSADDLETLLNQKVSHGHRIRGVWDADRTDDKARTPCAECAARDRLRAALRGELSAEERAAWDAYAAERQATAKPDDREDLQARIDVVTERAIREKVAAEIEANVERIEPIGDWDPYGEVIEQVLRFVRGGG